MSSHCIGRAIAANLVVFVGMSIACGTSSPLGPTVSTTLSVISISPSTGLVGDVVNISGTGFLSGTTVTLGSPPLRMTVASGLTIIATVAAHAPGTVDVVVTNPGGQSVTMTGAFRYAVVTLTVSPSVLRIGGELSVSWVAPGGRSHSDWLALFKVGDPNELYGSFAYTGGALSGQATLTAPLQPGQYEVRYLLDDGFIDAGRSSPVTVTAGG